MSRRPLIDQRLKNALPNHWPSRCSIQSVNFTSSTSGQEIPGAGTDIEGLTDLECRMGPVSLGTPLDDEMRTQEITEGRTRRILWINGYYVPQIESSTMQAVVDGVIFNIIAVESDSQKCYTRLRLEDMQPHG